MKLYLFGWADAEIKEIEKQLKLFEDIIKKIQPKQVLHIPFARSPETEKALGGPDWFIKHIDLQWSEYLNATNPKDIEKAENPTIIITGGWQTGNLLEKVKSSPKLMALINNAKYIISESAGSMILADYARIKDKTGINLMKALWIIKDTIIEPHYTQRGYQQLLTQEMKEANVKYGIWIDEITGIEFDLKKFPHEWKKIWDGEVEIKENNQ